MFIEGWFLQTPIKGLHKKIDSSDMLLKLKLVAGFKYEINQL